MTGDVRLIPQPDFGRGHGVDDDQRRRLSRRVPGHSFGLHTNPYLGIVFFVVVPALFIAGLLLIPLGAWIERPPARRRQPPSPRSGRAWT